MSKLLSKKTNEITDLNFSYNALNVVRDKEVAMNFLDKLKEFLHSSNVITHLEISGMNIGDNCLELLPIIKSNSSLRVVHLSNNMISKDTKKFMFNNLAQDHAEEKRQIKKSRIKLINNNDNF